MRINIITLFPEFFKSPLETGVLGRAIRSGFIKIFFINPRSFTEDKYQSVDDSPFGGGDGMVLKYIPLKKAIESLSLDISEKIIYLSPQGPRWNYKQARKFAEQKKNLTFICGRYGGVDQRIISEYVKEEISVGDYVLTGGEPALLVILDSLTRFIQGALGNKQSSNEESFEHQGLLEAPQWTRPREISGYKIPEIIFSGHHKDIKNFRYLMSLFMTALKRPSAITGSLSGKDLSKALEMVQSFSEEELKALSLHKKDLENIKQQFFNHKTT